jgi:hypothetical protein
VNLHETITAIQHISWTDTSERGVRIDIEGFAISTTAQTLRMGIASQQDCCENWGYFMTNDDTRAFIGARLLAVRLVDTSLNVRTLQMRMKEPQVHDDDEIVATMFVNLETDRGTLQFTAYNEQNGSYGHAALIESIQLQHKAIL